MGLFGTNVGPDIKIGGGDNGLLGQVGTAIQRPFSEIGKFFSGPDVPQYQSIAPTKQLTDQLAEEEKRAQQSPEEYQKKLMAGVDQSGSDVGFDPMSQALGSRAQRAFEKSGGDLSRQAQTQSTLNRLSQTQRAYDQKVALENYKRGIDYRYQAAQIQAEQTRSQVMNQLFGGLGQSVGVGLAAFNRPSYSPATPLPSVSAVPQLTMPSLEGPANSSYHL